jgi:hypothetical protein
LFGTLVMTHLPAASSTKYRISIGITTESTVSPIKAQIVALKCFRMKSEVGMSTRGARMNICMSAERYHMGLTH